MYIVRKEGNGKIENGKLFTHKHTHAQEEDGVVK